MLTDLATTPVGTPTDWEPLTHNTANQTTGGIWRITGPGGTAVLKHLTPGTDTSGAWATSDQPRHWNYWRREHLAYTTGTAEHYGAGTDLTAPRLLDTAERRDGSLELWLEDVQGTGAEHWNLDRLTHFAATLGTAQAHHTRTPEQPWHSATFLRQYAGRHHYRDIPWDHPAAARHWPADLRTGLRTMWEQRHQLFDIAEALPHTLCHLDIWPKNLTATTEGTVVLDWAFTGRGAIGEDLANLIADTFLDGLQPVEALADTENALTDAYLTALAHNGIDEPATTRKAIAATGAAKYAWLAPAMLTRLAAGKTIASANYDSATEDGAVLDRRRPIFAMLVRWARAALDT